MASTLQSGDAKEVREVAKAFGATTAQLVMPLLQRYVEQRDSLPPVVHDQRDVEVP
jgi:hypothetical protein